jgi:hypothetical protein
MKRESFIKLVKLISDESINNWQNAKEEGSSLHTLIERLPMPYVIIGDAYYQYSMEMLKPIA